MITLGGSTAIWRSALLWPRRPAPPEPLAVRSVALRSPGKSVGR